MRTGSFVPVGIAVELRFFVINLERSVNRWRDIEASARDAGLDVARIEATDGNAVPRDQWIDVDQRRFGLCHGRWILPGEYGCYRSHLSALDAIIEAGDPIGVVCEDDILLNRTLPPLIRSSMTEKPKLDALKLANHRVQGFVRHGLTEGGVPFGRCIHGPQGSAACYAVTQAGAQRLRETLATMWLPYDIALERGWAMGVSLYTTRENAIAFNGSRGKSTITPGKASSYKASKYPRILRTPVAAFRAADYVRRARYAVWT